MKKLYLTIALLLLALLSAGAQSRILLAYFSWGGNTQALAEEIGRQTGADMFRIEPVVPYSTDYDVVAYTTSVQERDSNARPAIKDRISNLAQYDYIFIGTPVWWMQDPMIIHTFMETSDYGGFAGKTVIPFCTYYSGQSTALSDIVAGTPLANHLEGFSTRGASSYNSATIRAWLQRIGMLDVVSGISGVTPQASAPADGRIYRLDGSLATTDGSIAGLARGLYVRGGHKIMIR